jgi:hypothetical protein
MNPFKLKASLLLLLGGLMTASTSQATLTYTAGDIFLGFRSTDTNVTQSYLVNIGSGSHFRDATSSFSIGNLSSDLTTVFGSGWATDPKVTWGVVGVNSTAASGTFDGDPTRTLYSSLSSNGLIPLADPIGPARGGSSTQATPGNKIDAMRTDFLTYSSAAFTNGAITNAGSPSSYTTFAGASIPFSYFATGMEGTFANGASGTSLDLFRMAPGSSSLKGSYEGTFLMDSSGSLSFNVVPEPTGVVLLLCSGLALTSRRRRPLLA